MWGLLKLIHSPHVTQDVTELEEWLANEQRASVMAARELQREIDALEQVRTPPRCTHALG